MGKCRCGRKTRNRSRIGHRWRYECGACLARCLIKHLIKSS
jgi:hypothetical protein